MTSRQDRISVIVPTFNRAALLLESIQSLLSQTHPPYEIIIVDDGSNAENHSRLSEYTNLHPSISIYTLPQNSGLGSARNFGIEKATGDFVLFLDDDDLLHPEALESNLACFSKHPDAGVIACRSSIFRGAGYSGITPAVDQTNGDRLEANAFSEILLFVPQINSCLVRRECLLNARFSTELKAGEDIFFWLSLAYQGVRFRFNPRVLAFVRLHAGNFQNHRDFNKEYIRFLLLLMSSGMLQTKRDYFVCRARLFQKFYKLRDPLCLKYLLSLLPHPIWLVQYFVRYIQVQLKKGSIPQFIPLPWERTQAGNHG